MANIFNLFGEVSELHKDPAMKPLARSKSSLGTNDTPLKNVSRSKPKGLSIRSKSDLNVSTTVQSSTPSKQQELLKPKLTQLDDSCQVISLKRNILLKKPTISYNRMKDVSPKKVSNTKNIKLPESYGESIFKKPLPVKSNIHKSYPEPESLAPYYDMQLEFDDIYTKTIENEFKELCVKKERETVPYEDEGFESDLEQIEIEMPELCKSPEIFDEEWIQFKNPDLPEISDDDDKI
ncbi:uncharacterized protein LOC117241907 isoform X1 [Bombus vosnesenskii]|uniref:Uncharacterized protein LOC117241907 isoform X1 n=1 Tax=Bombus vosnesenskii TaxID=207650 RepID=A0A6J3LJM8_9HYME|nr:uncharacterized protein LOC117241907 isoform X1 [Bombus vosnesenskii]